MLYHLFCDPLLLTAAFISLCAVTCESGHEFECVHRSTAEIVVDSVKKLRNPGIEEGRMGGSRCRVLSGAP